MLPVATMWRIAVSAAPIGSSGSGGRRSRARELPICLVDLPNQVAAARPDAHSSSRCHVNTGELLLDTAFVASIASAALFFPALRGRRTPLAAGAFGIHAATLVAALALLAAA